MNSVVIDIIPIQIGEMYPTMEQVYHVRFKSENIQYNINLIKKDFLIKSGYSHGIILNNGKVVDMF